MTYYKNQRQGNVLHARIQDVRPFTFKSHTMTLIIHVPRYRYIFLFSSCISVALDILANRRKRQRHNVQFFKLNDVIEDSQFYIINGQVIHIIINSRDIHRDQIFEMCATFPELETGSDTRVLHFGARALELHFKISCAIVHRRNFQGCNVCCIKAI